MDEFEQPKQLKGKDAICILLIRLLLLTPGTIQSRPTMGIGIVTRWRYSSIDEIPNLTKEIETQINTYLPKFQAVEVQVTSNDFNKELLIDITIDGTLYSFTTDSPNNSIKLVEL